MSDQAIAAGYRPCAVCLPAQYRTWTAAAERSAPGAAGEFLVVDAGRA